MKALCKLGHTGERNAHGMCRECNRDNDQKYRKTQKGREALKRYNAGKWKKNPPYHAVLRAVSYARRKWGNGVVPSHLSPRDFEHLYRESLERKNETNLRHVVTYIVHPRDGGLFSPENLVVVQNARGDKGRGRSSTRLQLHETRRWARGG